MSVPVTLRKYAPQQDSVLPDETVVFIRGALNAPANEPAFIDCNQGFIVHSGDPKDEGYQEGIFDMYLHVYAIGQVISHVELQDDSASRAFNLAVSEWIVDEIKHFTIKSVSLLLLSSRDSCFHVLFVDVVLIVAKSMGFPRVGRRRALLLLTTGLKSRVSFLMSCPTKSWVLPSLTSFLILGVPPLSNPTSQPHRLRLLRRKGSTLLCLRLSDLSFRVHRLLFSCNTPTTPPMIPR